MHLPSSSKVASVSLLSLLVSEGNVVKVWLEFASVDAAWVSEK